MPKIPLITMITPKKNEGVNSNIRAVMNCEPKLINRRLMMVIFMERRSTRTPIGIQKRPTARKVKKYMRLKEVVEKL